ncbi:MAG: hypothetical protein Greene101447_239 [Parcubacteria group bacterium Greene1014_47]|nr:MAG: hypothetical protein Greene101447_239 [Parcubacteria group bacterium Greene1014_47]
MQAEGKVTVIPDIASLSFSVLTDGGTDLVNLQQENTQKANDAIAFAKDQGIDEKDIKTSAYNIQPRYQYSRCSEGDGICPPPEIVGYSISQMVELKIRDFEKIGTILAGLVGKGANTVSGLSFGVDDPEMVQNEARAEAIEKAKGKARALARAGGFKLGKLISIEEGGVSPTPFYTLEAQGKERSSLPTIEPGSQDITVDVTLKFEIR